jgi:hypothetical protein
MSIRDINMIVSHHVSIVRITSQQIKLVEAITMLASSTIQNLVAEIQSERSSSATDYYYSYLDKYFETTVDST